MNDFNIKLENAIKLAKNYLFESSGLFALMADCDGWTDGFIANLKPIDVDLMKAKAKIYSAKNPSFRYTIEPDKTPKIQPILSSVDNNDYEPVIDIEWDLLTNSIILKSENSQEKINPKYLKYFTVTYKAMMSPDMFICKNLKMSPIELKIGGDRVGLIMPMRD